MSRLSRIRLEPAPAAHEPRAESSYEFVAPLDSADGRIDAAAWKSERGVCFVHRLEGGDIVQRGLLIHRPGGAGGGSWAFDYALGSGEEDVGYRFDEHRFVPGEYASVRDPDGDLRTYRVSVVQPA